MASQSNQCYSLAELCERVGGSLVGDASYQVSGIADLACATESELGFLSSDKYVSTLASSKAGCVLLKASHSEEFSGNKIVVEDPYLAYAKISRLFETRHDAPSQPGQAYVDSTATLGENVRLGPGCFIGAGAVVGSNVECYPGVYIGENARVGDDVTLFPNVVIYHEVELGSRVIVHANTTLGCDGFGFAPSKGQWQKIHQLGRVIVGSDVEIGGNCSIDRGALGDTVIDDHVIIDNQVHIAHNVKIGRGTAIAGCVGIAGSATIGKNCLIAGAVAINGHIEIADNTSFHGGSIVTKGNSEPGAFASTPPLQDIAAWRKNAVRYRQLDALFSRVKTLEKALESLDKN